MLMNDFFHYFANCTQERDRSVITHKRRIIFLIKRRLKHSPLSIYLDKHVLSLRSHRGLLKGTATSLRILVLTLSGPEALPIFKVFKMSLTSVGKKVIESSVGPLWLIKAGRVAEWSS